MEVTVEQTTAARPPPTPSPISRFVLSVAISKPVGAEDGTEGALEGLDDDGAGAGAEDGGGDGASIGAIDGAGVGEDDGGDDGAGAGAVDGDGVGAKVATATVVTQTVANEETFRFTAYALIDVANAPVSTA